MADTYVHSSHYDGGNNMYTVNSLGNDVMTPNSLPQNVEAANLKHGMLDGDFHNREE